MKIEYLKSASYILHHKKFKVLVDPWLVDGEYYGSWSHYPKFNINKLNLDKIDFILITHIHPDHFSELTLKKFNKKTKIIILKYAKPFLRQNIELLGFNDIIEIDHKKRYYFDKNFFVEIYAADNCNPKLCGKFFGCEFFKSNLGTNQIDSLSLFSDKKKVILNVNDCPFDMAKSVLKDIIKKYKTIDLLLTGYVGAGPYPQCFSLEKNMLEKEITKKKKQFINQALNFIKIIKPKYVMPFAGTYFLSSGLFNLNKHRGVTTRFEALKIISKSAIIKKIKSNVFILKTFGVFDLNKLIFKNKLEKEDVFFDKNMKKYLTGKTLIYENEPQPKEQVLIKKLYIAAENMFRKINQLKINSKTILAIKINTKILFIINFHKSFYEVSDYSILKKNNYLLMDLDLRLLKKILDGPRFAHWNNADIGSHIKYTRIPNKYERAIHYAVNFLYC